MACPPDKLKRAKLLEAVSGLRSLQDLGIKIHMLKHIKLYAKLIMAETTSPSSALLTIEITQISSGGRKLAFSNPTECRY